jgi:hypothetical protein
LIKVIVSGAAAAALLGSSAPAAAATHLEAPAWVVVPDAKVCRTEIELTGASGRTFPAAFTSDGEQVSLVFAKADAPQQAFLPIRIDHKPFSNLMVRQDDGKSAAIQLSPEAQWALRKGSALQIGWLGDEPVEIGLAGSDQAITDLKTCGAQVAERFRADEAERREAAARAESEARAQALADEQLAAVRAQKAAAEAERERAAAEARKLSAEAEAARQEQARADADPYARDGEAYSDPSDRYQPDPYAGRYDPWPYRRW